MLEGFDALKTDMVGATVRAIDDGIGLAGQLVMEALVHQPANDGRGGRAGLDDVVADPTFQPILGEGAVHRLDDVTSHAEIAEALLRFKSDHPLAGTSGRGEPHGLQMLEAANHEPAGLSIGDAGLLGT